MEGYEGGFFWLPWPDDGVCKAWREATGIMCKNISTHTLVASARDTDSMVNFVEVCSGCLDEVIKKNPQATIKAVPLFGIGQTSSLALS